MDEPGKWKGESAEQLYEQAPCGYISTLPDGTLLQVNQTFVTWTGYSREELLAGKRLQELLTGGGRLFYETQYVPLLRMQGFVHEVNLDLVHKQQHQLPMLLNSSLNRDAEGRPLSIRTVLFIISDRKKYERELLRARQKAEEAAKTKADFLSMISHEIRTPMNAIIGVSNLLGDTPLSAQQREYVRLLQLSSENLLGLLNDILDFNKIEAGKVTLEERGFDIRQLLYSTLYGLSIKAEEKNLAVHVDLDEQVPAHLFGDPIKLGQVFTNLLHNAIKFTETGSITVALRVRESFPDAVSLECRVTDTGIGIAQDRLARIFEEFTQGGSEIHVKYGGSGLGLAISQKLLALHGSRIFVESVPGKGSSFSFTLRLRMGRRAEEADAPAKAVPDGRTLRGLRLLVADDNDVNVFVLTRFLRDWGVEFEVVGNGQQAVEKVMGGDYDLVLMDLQMPELDGYEATRMIRNLPEEKFRRLPIIALSASTKIGLEDRLDSVGLTDFIGKPFKPEELFAKLTLHSARSVRSTPGSPLVEKREQEQTGEASSPPPPGFSLERFRELTRGDRRSLMELSTITLKGCERCRREIQEALETGSQESFRFHTHKLKMTMELLQAGVLQSALQQGWTLLAEKERDPVRIRAVVHAIQRELDAIIQALYEEVRNASP